MRLRQHSGGFTVWLSATDTAQWAARPGAAWPCSTLAGKRLVAEFDSNGLVDMALNGRGGADVPGDEFNACLADHLAGRLKPGNPAFFIAVGQFTKQD